MKRQMFSPFKQAGMVLREIEKKRNSCRRSSTNIKQKSGVYAIVSEMLPCCAYIQKGSGSNKGHGLTDMVTTTTKYTITTETTYWTDKQGPK